MDERSGIGKSNAALHGCSSAALLQLADPRHIRHRWRVHFYEKMNYKQEGDIFEENGITFAKMVKEL